MKNSLLIFLFLLGLSCQVLGQTPAKDFEGSWQGTLEAGGQKLRVAVTVTKSDAGTYAGKLDSLDQGARIRWTTKARDRICARSGRGISSNQDPGEARCALAAGYYIRPLRGWLSSAIKRPASPAAQTPI